MRRLPPPEQPLGPGPGARAEEIAARVAMIDRTQAAAGSSYSGREVYTRRTGEISDAMASTPLIASGERLGQAYNRAPRPTVRREDL